jgi:oligoribonuclease NrnB/cAMP/cGMP phosphodiesterase (DHH superfamily)
MATTVSTAAIPVVPDVGVVHYPCPDGLACELLMKDVFGKEFPVLPYQHGVTQLDASWMSMFKGKKVWIADWYFASTEPLVELSRIAQSVTIWDHHLSAKVVNDQVIPLKLSNVTVTLADSQPCGAVMLFKHLYPNEKALPSWLRIIDLHDTGRFKEMTLIDQRIHAALTDDLKLMNERRKMKDTDLEKIGATILEAREKEIAKILPATFVPTVQKFHMFGEYSVVYLDLQVESLIKGVTEQFWHRFPNICEILILRKKMIPSSDHKTGEFIVDFKLRHPPNSDLDLRDIATEYTTRLAKSLAEDVKAAERLSILYTQLKSNPTVDLPNSSKKENALPISVIGGGGHAAAAGIQLRNTDILPNLFMVF